MLKAILYRLVLVFLLVVPVVMAVRYWFVCDDAFIAFRFVRNLVDGYGPVFNVGEAVEGYTSFLWVVELAAIWKVLGVRPEDAAPVLSLFCTVVTGLGVVALAERTPMRPRRGVVMVALLWWATNRSVWVWSTSGLEERQFTALLTWAVVLLSDRRRGGRAIAGSALVGLAALTRPEAYLIGPIALAWAMVESWRAGVLDKTTALRLLAPAGALVGAHLLWRHSYYGEWLPNTYYAKNVRDWWEAGLGYLAYGALEHALWAVLPLAVVGTVVRARAGDSAPVLMWLWAVPSYVHLAKIGGDHFEFRMFDVLWPPLYVAAADGLAALLTRYSGATLAGGYGGVALAGAALVVDAWGLAIPLAHDTLAEARNGRAETEKMQVQPTVENVPWLAYAQPIPLLLGVYDALEARLISHSVAVRFREHQVFAALMRRRYERYQLVESRDFFQPDAVTAESSVGVYGYYLPGMTLIDLKGLCDHTIARTPVARDDDHRQLAHDRAPPKGYLAKRGVNLEIEAVHESKRGALADGTFAIQIGPTAFAGFIAVDPAYAERAFPAFTLLDRTLLSDPWAKEAPLPEAVAASFVVDDVTWQVERWIGQFDDAVDGWTLTGRSFARQPARGTWMGQAKVSGYEGVGLLNSYHPSWADFATGSATSPAFTARPGDALALRLAGGLEAGEVVLLADGQPVASWKGTRGTALQRFVRPLDDVAGRSLTLELRDTSPREAGWLALDAVAIVRRAP